MSACLLFSEVESRIPIVSAVFTKEVTRCDKLNIAAIGNIVPQLHIHIVARRKDDPLWPKPVWGLSPPRAGETAAFTAFIAAIRNGLGLPAGG